MFGSSIPTYNTHKLEKVFTVGKTTPFLVQTDNGFYVVKHKNNDDGPRVLANEFVCYKLARLLDIPIPNAALINIDQRTIEADNKLQELNVKPGLHFGSEFIKKAQTYIQPPLLERIINHEDIPSIILFDQIIYNNDRTNNPGNLIIDIKEKKILAIDHSHPFKLGALWDKRQLESISEEQISLVRDFHGQNYKVLLKYVNGHSPFNKILRRISDISEEKIDWCLEQIPDEWNISEEDTQGLKSFILDRIHKVEDILILLKDECPDWKGGDLFE